MTKLLKEKKLLLKIKLAEQTFRIYHTKISKSLTDISKTNTPSQKKKRNKKVISLSLMMKLNIWILTELEK